jgi:hypothetical protein
MASSGGDAKFFARVRVFFPHEHSTTHAEKHGAQVYLPYTVVVVAVEDITLLSSAS